jgi:hypothetical protein
LVTCSRFCQSWRLLFATSRQSQQQQQLDSTAVLGQIC